MWSSLKDEFVKYDEDCSLAMEDYADWWQKKVLENIGKLKKKNEKEQLYE